MPNPYESEARTRKAVAIADMLDAFGLTPEQASALAVGERLDVATAAGVKVPSEPTWEQAVGTLRQRLAVRAALPADPFAGLTA